MDLFQPIGHAKSLHPHFISIIAPEKESERQELLRWAEGFEDRDGKFVQEFQTTFNSSFWELFIFAVLKEYGMVVDWNNSSPDFIVDSIYGHFTIEATTANAAQGKPNEWDKTYSSDEVEQLSLTKLNHEAIIRLANAFISKYRYYNSRYASLEHVKNKPFVLAIAPFEQPHFNLQYNRPILALLYDHYIDEEAYLRSPNSFPGGIPISQLGYVTKDNGAEIPLGLFNDDTCSDISAVIFSNTATWGKISAMTHDSTMIKHVQWVWASEPDGSPMLLTNNEHVENLTDGLQIFHNPYAKHPLSLETFRRKGVVQYYIDKSTNQLLAEETNRCLYFRQVINLKSV